MSFSTITDAPASDVKPARTGRLTLSTLWDIAAPTTILVAPTLAFASFHNYSFFSPEIFVGIGLLACLGAILGYLILGRTKAKVIVIALLLTLYMDLQFAPVFVAAGPFWSKALLPLIALGFLALSVWLRQHLTLLATTFFGTIVISTLLFPPGGTSVHLSVNEQLDTDTALPPVVHIVLDEHIGIEGIPEDIEVGAELKRDLKAFFDRHGFYVFGKAFSRFYRSEWSLGHLFNPDSMLDEEVVERVNARFVWKVRENDYFEGIQDAGYNINVYQFEHIDYCESVKRRLSSCLTYNVSSLGAIQNTSLTTMQKLRVISGFYVYYSSTYRFLRDAYGNLMRHFVAPQPPLSQWHWERTQVGSIAAFETLDRLRHDLENRATGGQYYFAHLDLPHYPYMYDRDCRLKAPAEWATRNLPHALRQYAEPTSFRTHNYQMYLDQMRCMYTKLGELLEVIESSEALKNTVVILHGDHGSRITMRAPRAKNRSTLTTQEMVDNFSTLFAISAPGIDAGYDRRLVPIQELLTPLYENRFRAVPDFDKRDVANRLMLQGQGGWVSIPMPDFGD